MIVEKALKYFLKWAGHKAKYQSFVNADFICEAAMRRGRTKETIAPKARSGA